MDFTDRERSAILKVLAKHGDKQTNLTSQKGREFLLEDIEIELQELKSCASRCTKEECCCRPVMD